MVTRKKVNAGAAKEYMDAHSLFCTASGLSTQKPVTPSTVYVELPTRPSIKVNLSYASLSSISMASALVHQSSASGASPHSSSSSSLQSHLLGSAFQTPLTSPIPAAAPEPLTLNVAFATLGIKPVHLVLDQSHAPHPLQQSLLGTNKGFNWLIRAYDILDRIKLTTTHVPRANLLQQNKLKLISILLNLVVHRLLQLRPNEGAMFLTFLATAMRMSASTVGMPRFDADGSGGANGESAQDAAERSAAAEAERAAAMLDQVPASEPVLLVAFPLILALWRVFYFSVEQWVAGNNAPLARALLGRQCAIVESMVARVNLLGSLVAQKTRPVFDRVLEFMDVHAARWQATMFLLCDCLSMSPTVLTEGAFSSRSVWFVDRPVMRGGSELDLFHSCFSHPPARFLTEHCEAFSLLFA
jgi:hypothetical protein